MTSDLTLAGNAPLTPAADLTRRQKAAIVVRLLRHEGIELSLASLPDEMQVGLTREMSSLRLVSRDALRAVVDEFVTELDGIGLSFSGGIGGALSLLDGALSPSVTARLRAEAGRAAITDAWQRLDEMEAERLSPVIAEESIEIGAVALSKLSVAKAAEILGSLPGETARRLAYAMSQTASVGPDAVTRIGQALLERLDSQPKTAFSGGAEERVGAILNFSPAATRDDVLDGLEKEDKPFADGVRRSIFTFVNIPQRLDPKDVPKIVREVDATLLTNALKAGEAAPRTAKAVEFILANMSQRLAAQLRDEMEALGDVKDAEAAMNAVVAEIRRLEAEQQIMLLAGDEPA